MAHLFLIVSGDIIGETGAIVNSSSLHMSYAKVSRIGNEKFKVLEQSVSLLKSVLILLIFLLCLSHRLCMKLLIGWLIWCIALYTLFRL